MVALLVDIIMEEMLLMAAVAAAELLVAKAELTEETEAVRQKLQKMELFTFLRIY